MLRDDPTKRLKRLAHKSPKRPLLTPAQFEKLCSTALTACERNGQELHDYLRFLAYCGAREKEALHIRWVDVDLKGKRLVIGADGLSKNSGPKNGGILVGKVYGHLAENFGQTMAQKVVLIRSRCPIRQRMPDATLARGLVSDHANDGLPRSFDGFLERRQW